MCKHYFPKAYLPVAYIITHWYITITPNKTPSVYCLNSSRLPRTTLWERLVKTIFTDSLTKPRGCAPCLECTKGSRALQSPRTPHKKAPMLGLIFCYCLPDILNHFLTRIPIFSFCTRCFKSHSSPGRREDLKRLAWAHGSVTLKFVFHQQLLAKDH